MTLEEFITATGITATAEHQGTAPWPGHRESDKKYLDPDKWMVTIRNRDERGMILPFYMGSGYRIDGTPQPPSIDMLIVNFISDGRSINDEPFESWANYYGYDPDSRTAEQTYYTIKAQQYMLRGLLGTKLYRTLIDDVEVDI